MIAFPPFLQSPLHRIDDEHDGCGVGFLADVNGRYRSDLLSRALQALENLQHRGASGADARTGDGAGVLFSMPQSFFSEVLSDATGVRCEGPVGVAMCFWPRDKPAQQHRARQWMIEILERRGLAHWTWRTVPVRPEILGVKAANSRPLIQQLVVGFDQATSPIEADRRLYGVRREFEATARAHDVDVYVASMSARTIVYKGLMMADALADFYPDLSRQWATNFAVFHQRFSTNTFPSWPLAQPFRRLGHNGEINTIVGNANNTEMREEDLASPIWGEDLAHIRPLLQRGFSDSALLDNVVELLELSGRSMTHVLPMLIPQAWENDRAMSDEVRAFFEYHACLNEPWDGPAAVLYADGRYVGAHLDRNGLRPLRYQKTDDGLLCASSEVGVLDVLPARISARGRLGPGHMLAVDLESGEVLTGDNIKAQLAAQAPYRRWVDAHLEVVNGHCSPTKRAAEDDKHGDDRLLRCQLAFGYSGEEMRFVLGPMTDTGAQPISSMGDDTPLSVLSRLPRLLPTYFKQRFAQVTNPPIDPIRERSMMSLGIHLGRRRNWLDDGPKHTQKIALPGPVMTDAGLDALRELAGEERLKQLHCTFAIADGPAAMVDRLDELCEQAEKAVDEGADILCLSDRDVDANRAPIPILLAVGAVTTHLLRAGKRLRASLVVESGEPRDVHHVATLIGYGAGAVVPYLAIATIRDQCEEGEEAVACDIENFVASLEKGLLKIMSKMGISVLGSYRGAQIFEAVGIAQEVIERCFPHTPSPVAGVGFEQLAQDAMQRHLRAFGPDRLDRLQDLGYFRFRRHGESHAWGPPLLGAMNKFRRGREGAYEAFSKASRDAAPMHLRDLMEFEPIGDPLPLEEVESVASIRRRFTTAAMSLGALSPEAHEALAVAMNRIGGKSNSGEGGEDPARFVRRENGDSAESAIKQVASARFGVTPEYLARARELEIKMAQGSKPGEGGQLPAHKVTEYIAELRHATAGVPLISPPPHHDIYSIEDLAQLIYDLKTINTSADICVKLVSESGVGTIAAGVAKAFADVILISGHDGGTGASPLSSIKNAGNAWEIGLAEVQQVLCANGLRERVKVRVDGGLKTGRDIVVAALLGAEEFNFGTAALISLGCRYVRQCHLDTCPVGIATQREDLRQKFEGDPDNVVAYFNSVAHEIREILARLGARSIQEIVGRTEALRAVEISDHRRAATVDISALLAGTTSQGAPYCTWPDNGRPHGELNDRLVADALPQLERDERFEGRYGITNRDRTVGARLAGVLAMRPALVEAHSGSEDAVRLHFEGTAGQSFGAFATTGLTLILDGEANDYVAKGLGGGRVVVRHPLLRDEENSPILVGNTVLYGATGGELFVAGSAGERFAVRNSGARAVVEGTGHHGCEYMTAGTVVVLGHTGQNFGAGMTGGQAFVYDPQRALPDLHHPEFVLLQSLGNSDDGELFSLIQAHRLWTGSAQATAILNDWTRARQAFWRVIPRTLVDESDTDTGHSAPERSRG